jgi:hypothetical protein
MWPQQRRLKLDSPLVLPPPLLLRWTRWASMASHRAACITRSGGGEVAATYGLEAAQDPFLTDLFSAGGTKKDREVASAFGGQGKAGVRLPLVLVPPPKAKRPKASGNHAI